MEDPLCKLIKVAARDANEADNKAFMCNMACTIYGDEGAELLTRDTGFACAPCSERAPPRAPPQPP